MPMTIHVQRPTLAKLLRVMRVLNDCPPATWVDDRHPPGANGSEDFANSIVVAALLYGPESPLLEQILAVSRHQNHTIVKLAVEAEGACVQHDHQPHHHVPTLSPLFPPACVGLLAAGPTPHVITVMVPACITMAKLVDGCAHTVNVRFKRAPRSCGLSFTAV